LESETGAPHVGISVRNKGNNRGEVMKYLAGACLSSLSSILALSTAAFAQMAPANSEREVQPASASDGEIVVTAQRRSQRLQDVPVSVSVATGATLERANITNLEGVAIRTPNVRISSAPVSDFINIRGIGSSLNLGFEQSVATFVDGVYRARSRASRAALFDIEQVEVLKGPQTTFFGNNAIAGALNITTRKPSNSPQANASAFYAPATHEYTLEAGVSGPITDTL
jgi:iron complex outermembrane receptor protein